MELRAHCLYAHDRKKKEMIHFTMAYREMLKQVGTMVATNQLDVAIGLCK